MKVQDGNKCAFSQSFQRLIDTLDPKVHLPTDFTAGYIENVFSEESFERLSQLAEEADIDNFNLHPQKYLYKVFPDKDFIRLIYGLPFLQFLHRAAKRPIQRFQKFPFPQLHHFRANSKGLHIHNDVGHGREFATLFYLNSSWSDDKGGELSLYKRTEEGFDEIARIAPKPNSLFFFEVCEYSWHAVQPMQGDWVRNTLIVDWEFA